jgi:hypothetical protein
MTGVGLPGVMVDGLMVSAVVVVYPFALAATKPVEDAKLVSPE